MSTATRIAAHRNRQEALEQRAAELRAAIKQVNRQAASGTGLPGAETRLARFTDQLAAIETEVAALVARIHSLRENDHAEAI